MGELLREGARRPLAQAVEAELSGLLERNAGEWIGGKQAVVRNGYLPERSIQTGLGEVPVKIPQ